MVGKRSIHRRKYGSTVRTWVCWSMISETHTAYGSLRMLLHGRSRLLAENHSTMASPIRRAISGEIGAVGMSRVDMMEVRRYTTDVGGV